MEPVVYRLATAHDITALVRLRAMFLAESTATDPTSPALVAALEQYFSSAVPSGEFVAILAEAAGQIIATSGLVFHRHAPSARNLSGIEGYILNMYTLPAWRRQGLATTILQKLLAVARERGCFRVSLHALPQGRSIYTQMGFAPVDTEMRLTLQHHRPET